MNKVEAAKKMRDLEKEIRHHQHLYYKEHKSIISDREFDRLLDELIKLEEAYPDLISEDSPSKLVGSDLDADFEKFQHTIPVLSLANTYSTKEAMDWAKKTASNKKDLFVIQWKVDGATLVLYYKKGKLTKGVTRGSGQIGDDITANAKTIRNIPHILTEAVDVTVRGEVYMTFEDFEKFNEEWGSIYANPRNLTSGSLKQKKSKDTAKRPLRLVAFDSYFDRELLSDKDQLQYLEKLGFPVFQDNAFVTIDKLEESITKFEKKKNTLPFPVDGLVIKLNQLSLREDLGFTAHSPRWATALKFEPELAETIVDEIEVFTGRTGRVTPRARLKPVKLAGTTVTYATLHNEEYIKTLDVRIGATVRISKRGEIIPAVEEVIDPGKEKPFVFPVTCPVCRSKLKKDESAADWMCVNEDCPEKKIQSIIFFAGRKQMDIAGLGEKVVERLFHEGFLNHIEDIYTLYKHKEKLESLEGFGKKSVDLLLRGIEKSKQKTFRFVLPSLGLKELGHSVTEILIEEGYSDIDSLIKVATDKNALEKLTSIYGIGERTAASIIKQLGDPALQKRIHTLRSSGLKFYQEKQDTTNFKPIFENTIWCVTGSFAHYKPRDLAMEEVKKRGGKVTSSVSNKTTHLLAGEEAGSKLDKAKELGITVVNEQEFLKMLNNE